MLLLACTGSPENPDFVHLDTSSPSADTGELPLLAEADVVVIGGGASGLTAAVEAASAGASVLIIERDVSLGGAGLFAGNYFAAGTKWQAAAGIEDSPEAALAEWADFTGGGDPGADWVQGFVYGSAETLEWLVGFGAAFSEVTNDPGAGTVDRIHALDNSGGGGHPISALAALVEKDALLSTTAVSLVDEAGTVVGVVVEDGDGSIGWVAADAVVVATGGFARDDDRVYAAVPELLQFPRHVEAWPGMDGNGLDLIEAVGGSLVNLENIALYAHGVTDANHGSPEVMVVVDLANSVVVGDSAMRVMDEDDLRAIWGGRRMLETGQLYAVFDQFLWENRVLIGTGYNYSKVSQGTMTGGEYDELVDVAAAGDLVGLGNALGLDGSALAKTVAGYNDMVVDGVDTAFGKDLTNKSQLLNPPYVAVPLTLATGKSFGGAALAGDGGVLGADGLPIPGLFAAGEVAGMLGGSHLGQGISGSITAVLYSGRVAGAGAAAHASL